MGAARVVLCLIIAFSQQPGEAHPATVSGRVVDAVSGRPIPGVIVSAAGSAVPSAAGSAVPSAAGSAVPSAAGSTAPRGAAVQPRALTNGQGEFILRGLRKGTLHFVAEKSGYGTASYNQRRPGGSGQGLKIEDAQRLDGVEIRMWRYASISGTVVDEAGEPAVGVRVRAFQRSFVAGLRRFTTAGAGFTDDRGVYRIADLVPGDYAVGVPAIQTSVPTEVMDVFFGPSGGGSREQRLRVSRELNQIGSAVVPAGSQYAFATGDQTFTLPLGTLMPQADTRGGIVIYPTVFYPAAASLGQAGTVALRAGEERSSIDLQVHPARAVRLSGTIVAPDGPASNVGVRLVPSVQEDAVDTIDVATTMTATNGDFTFAAVPPGQYRLRVLSLPREPLDLDEGSRIRTTPGGSVTIGSAVPPASATPPGPAPVPSDATLYADMALAIGDTPVSGVVVALAAAPRVSGRLEFEGATEKPSAAALLAIRINLDPADGSRIGDATIASEAGHPDEDGRFHTFGVPPGRYVLRVNPPSGWTLKGAFAGANDISDVPFGLTARDTTDVVITFTDRPAAVSGVVRAGPNGDPDAVVLVFPTDASAWSARGAFPRRMRVGRTDKDGAYAIDGLPAGEYNLVAVHEESFSDWQDPALLEALARVARQFRVLDGERRLQDLTAAVIR